MRLLGFVLLVAGFLLCLSIVWATLGFLMMGFGLICLHIAERRRKRPPTPDADELAAVAPFDAAPRPYKAAARRQPAILLEPTFAAPPMRAECRSSRSELELPDFSISAEHDARNAPPPLPPLPAHAEASAPPAPPWSTASPPTVAEPQAAVTETRPETAPTEPAPLEAERAVLFDDSDDLANLFEKFDLGKDRQPD